MREEAPPEILASVRPSLGRIGLGILMNGALAALLVSIAVSSPPAALIWVLFLWAAAVAAGWGAISAWRSRHLELFLTETDLRDSHGREICRIENVRKVERGPFAVKPARGFLLILDRPAAGAWVPGVWWRVGRRVGVGGTTSAGATRMMAEIIESMIAERTD